jgi:hypothetical protein
MDAHADAHGFAAELTRELVRRFAMNEALEVRDDDARLVRSGAMRSR